MFSVKPGRGPSLLGAIAGAAMAVFGVIFLIASNAMMSNPAGALSAPPAAFRLIWNAFGVLFILVAAGMAVYNFINFSRRNRMSAVDITDRDEESDPVADMLGYGPRADADSRNGAQGKPRRFEGGHCPFCGAEVREEFDFCPNCGKDI